MNGASKLVEYTSTMIVKECVELWACYSSTHEENEEEILRYKVIMVRGTDDAV